MINQLVVMHTKTHYIPRILLHPLSIIVIISMCSILLNIYLYSGGWEESHTIYTSGIISFAIGYMYIGFFAKLVNDKKISNFTPHSPDNTILRLYWLLSIIGACIGFYIILTRGVMVPGNLYFNLRYAHIVEHQPTMGVGHLSLFSLAIAIYYAQNDDKIKSIIAASLSLLMSLAFAERTSILLLFTALTYTFVWKRKISVIHIVLLVFLCLLIFTIVAFSAGKLGAGGDFYVLKYFGYGLTSFQNNILSQPTYECPRMVFGNIIGGVLEGVGFYSCEAPSQFVSPGMFNVYTYALNPYLFGGIKYVMISMFVLGLFYSFIFHIAKRLEGFALAILSCLIYPVIMVFFAWQFSLTTFIYITIILVPLFYKVRVFSAYR